jgi:5'-3' exoribonuclease 1
MPAQDVVEAFAKLEDRLQASKRPETMKNAIIRGIPRRALLKPEHAFTRLQNQKFCLGDRVIVVSESGNVPLAAKGVVVGIQATLIDVVFDLPFIGGNTLGDRYVCPPHPPNRFLC